jgi:PhzF family phenazine biosynthesis protein
MTLRVAGVDAFSSVPMGGNGAAVVLLDEPAQDKWMQDLAAEFNQSETAFLWSHGSHWYLRWFTPSCEVDLCGHATLAATLALQHWSLLGSGQPEWFQTRSGPLQVEIGSASSAAIDLPSAAMQPRFYEPWMDSYRPLQQWTSDLGYGVLLLAADIDLQQLNPDEPCWAKTKEKGWVLMQQALKPRDYQLRFFAPGLGLREDPVTGSAHALVAPWWCQQLRQRSVIGWQPSHRPGGLCCQPLNNGMIRLTGDGVILWDGVLHDRPSVPSAKPWLALHRS